MTQKTTIQEFGPFLDQTIRVVGIDSKSRTDKLVAVYQFSIMLETNINTKEDPKTGYTLYMKHAIKSISQKPE